MPNHFHLLVKIKEEKGLKLAGTTPDRVQNPVGGKSQNPSLQFGKLFNSYAQAFNKKYSRHGSLFERPFRRKKIESETYLNQIIVYIHNNPVHHGFCNHPEKYAWSSYLTCLSDKPTKLNRLEVIERFECRKNFQYVHEENIDVKMIEQLLEL
jgi:REP element-mobilizing transposase RayT